MQNSERRTIPQILHKKKKAPKACSRIRTVLDLSALCNDVCKMVKKATKQGQSELRMLPDAGTRIVPSKNQGYTIPLPLWQDLVEEATRRKKLGLSNASQNAIAVAGIAEWLARNKGAAE